MFHNTTNIQVFYHRNSSRQCIYLVVDMDDNNSTGDQHGIKKLNQHLFNHFQSKDLGKIKYLMGFEIAQSNYCAAISQRKFVLDILEETDMLHSQTLLWIRMSSLYKDKRSLEEILGDNKDL